MRKMNRLTLVLVALLVAPFGVLVAGDEVAAPSGNTEQRSAESAGSDTTRCESRSAQDVVEQWRKQLDSKRVDSPLPCPETSTCGGAPGSCSLGGTCQWSGQITKEDTGLSECQLPSGDLLSCHGQKTVHVTTIPCEHCPCCSAPHPCPCPLDCGENVTLSCEN
jgi:hypothetical protein